MKKFILPLFLLLASVSQGFAQEAEVKSSPLRLLVGGALELGGDKVAEVYFTNGETQSVNAGQGISIAIGGELQFPKAERFLLRGTVGYKYVTTQADNAHIRLTRIPIILTANFMATDKIRLGAGLTTHQSINFNADNIGESVAFDGAVGPTFEVAYSMVGLSYTVMTYKDQRNMTYSANAIGLTFSGVFPKR